jgi:hypothetical protein
MPADMKKTPSYLKGLAETRARAAGEVLRYEKIAADVDGLLRQARDTLSAFDLLIVRFDARLNRRRERRLYRSWRHYRRKTPDIT